MYFYSWQTYNYVIVQVNNNLPRRVRNGQSWRSISLSLWGCRWQVLVDWWMRTNLTLGYVLYLISISAVRLLLLWVDNFVNTFNQIATQFHSRSHDEINKTCRFAKHCTDQWPIIQNRQIHYRFVTAGWESSYDRKEENMQGQVLFPCRPLNKKKTVAIEWVICIYKYKYMKK